MGFLKLEKYLDGGRVAGSLAGSESHSEDGGNLSTVLLLSKLVSGAGGETRVLPAPDSGDLQMKAIHFETDGGGDITVAATHIANLNANDSLVFADEGDYALLMSNNSGKWILVSSSMEPTYQGELSDTDASALSVTERYTRLESGGTGETRTLAAPPAGSLVRKTIVFETDGGGDVVVDGSNVRGLTTEDYTFANAGETVILESNGNGEWIEIYSDITAA